MKEPKKATSSKPTGGRRVLIKPWHERPAGPDEPNWAKHFVSVLRAPLENLRRKLPFPGTKITMWSDCAGKCTEKTAADKLKDELKTELGIDIDFRLYTACDTKLHCRDYVDKNFRPTHVTRDIFERDFASRSFQYIMCNKPCHLPNDGVDLYTCCCPCGPWSRRGKRLGFDDPHADVWWQAIETIQHMQPVMFIMENVMEVGSDMSLIQAEIKKKLGDAYASCTVNKTSPTHHGYPTEKIRFVVCGGRLDQISEASLVNSFAKLIDNPMVVEDTYWSLLGIRGLPDEVLDSVGLPPNPGDAVMIQKSPCKCSINPMIECPMHPCKCDKCRKQPHKMGVIAYQPLPCAWRKKASSYLDHAGLRSTAADGGKTYVQMLELMNLSVPTSARERNMLNIIARLPAAQPLRTTRLIFDLSQAIDRCRPRSDGVVPTMATNSRMWCMRAGRALTVSEMAKLMGENLDDVDLRVTSEPQMRHMLGMSMHVATAGFALAGLMAAFAAARE